VRKAKIVCTIGPASDSPAMLDRLIEGGMDAARLNFSHGSYESHGRAIKAIRETAGRRRVAVAIIQDLQGPRIRIGKVPPAGIDVTTDQTVTLLPGQSSTAATASARDITIPVTYPYLADDVKSGARVLINDGLIELKVERVTAHTVECRVVTGGRITSHKGINLPGTRISSPTITDKDREDLRFGVAQGVDYIALSFVRGAEDVAAAKKLIGEYGGDVPVIAKIERAEAVDCVESLLGQADGIMIARGDLGVEMGPEVVPILQKRLINEAKRRRCLVITATQMLESMTQSPRPTRAEASDVANAVFDGTDAVMLSAETAMGQYPVDAVRVMDRIVRAAEEGKEPGVIRRAERAQNVSFPEAICAAASLAAAAIEAKAIVAFSESGPTARLLSKQRPAAPIIAFTPFEPVRHRMALYWGVIPHTMPLIVETDKRISEVERRLKGEGLVEKGQRIIIVSGALAGQKGGTNLMKLHEVG
jgi:pyruvate kinase